MKKQALTTGMALSMDYTYIALSDSSGGFMFSTEFYEALIIIT